MTKKLGSTLIYIMTAAYFVTSMYILVFYGVDENLGWYRILSEAWKIPEYEEIFVIGIVGISLNLIVALMLFIFLGRSKVTDHCLAAIVWGLALIAWYFTPSLLINYVLGAVVVTIFTFPHLTSLGRRR